MNTPTAGAFDPHTCMWAMTASCTSKTNKTKYHAMNMTPRITNQRELRREFWQTFPNLPKRQITDYASTGKMYRTDTRVAWCDWIDALSKNGDISQELAGRATL